MALTIWHNPGCSTSRKTLALLTERGLTPTVRLYLTEPPSRDELKAVLAASGLTARGLLRAKEPLAAELGPKTADEDTILAAMVAHPILIERPVVISGARAALGRPPEAVTEIL